MPAWLGIAGPLRFRHEPDLVAGDPRLKLLALAARDEIRSPEDVAAEVASWTNTRVAIIPGASHFFIGRTDQLVALAGALVDELTGSGPRSTRA